MPVYAHLLQRGEELRSHPSVRLQDSSESGLRTGLLFGHGGSNTVYGAGVCDYLQLKHLSSAVDVMVTVCPPAAFLQGRMNVIMRKIYEEVICGGRFIEQKFLRKKIHLEILEEVFRDAFHEGNMEIVMKNPCPLYVAVTGLDGHGELLNAKAPGVDLVDALLATITLPTSDFKPKVIGGTPWVTGSLAMPLPIMEMAEKFNLTDILVVLNDPIISIGKKASANIVERKLAGLFVRPLSPGLLSSFIHRKTMYLESLAPALGKGGVLPNGCRVQIIAPGPKEMISRLCTHSLDMRIQFLRGREAAAVAFGDKKPKEGMSVTDPTG